jgi:hypothetical protein
MMPAPFASKDANKIEGYRIDREALESRLGLGLLPVKMPSATIRHALYVYPSARLHLRGAGETYDSTKQTLDESDAGGDWLFDDCLYGWTADG